MDQNVTILKKRNWHDFPRYVLCNTVISARAGMNSDLFGE